MTDGDTTDLVPAGSMLLIVGGVGPDGVYATRWSLDGVPLDDDAGRVLMSALDLKDPGWPDFDVQYGTKDRKKSGDSWKGNPEAVVKASSVNATAPVDDKGMQATARLLEVDTIDKKQMSIECSAMIPLIKGVTPRNYPASVKVTDGRIELVQRRNYPLDESKPHTADKGTTTFEIKLRGTLADNKVVDMRITSESKHSETLEAVK